jgi:hypothetical protein
MCFRLMGDLLKLRFVLRCQFHCILCHPVWGENDDASANENSR